MSKSQLTAVYTLREHGATQKQLEGLLNCRLAGEYYIRTKHDKNVTKHPGGGLNFVIHSIMSSTIICNEFLDVLVGYKHWLMNVYI